LSSGMDWMAETVGAAAKAAKAVNVGLEVGVTEAPREETESEVEVRGSEVRLAFREAKPAWAVATEAAVRVEAVQAAVEGVAGESERRGSAKKETVADAP